MSSFPAAAKEHLAKYKVANLGIREEGLWSRNKRTYPHMLPAERRLENILSTVREDYDRLSPSKAWKLHTDFHHLTSSQALAFNLFLPLVGKWPEAAVIYQSALDLPAQISEAELEAILDKEEGTTLDALLVLSNNDRVLVEVKFTEQAFGRATADKTHKEKLATTYLPALSGRVNPRCLEEKEFFANYQLYRNLACVRPGSRDMLILLLPKAHRSIWDHASEWTTAKLGELGQSVRLVALEDLLSRLKSAAAAIPALRSHVDALISKYYVAAA